MWLLIRLQKLWLIFCGKDTCWSLEHWPSSWVTEEPTLKSNIINELCELMGIWKVRTLPYHPQTNGQMEQASPNADAGWLENWVKIRKADWPKHLPELVHAYNSMRSAITGYNPHYLMFGAMTLHLPINFYFPTIMSTENHHACWSLCCWLMCSDSRKPSRRHKCSSHLRLKGRGNTMIIEQMEFDWSQVNWVLATSWCLCKGRRKVKDWWEEEPYDVECRIAEGASLPTSWNN